MLYAGAIRLIPGRRSRAGGVNSSPRSILTNVASTSETSSNATVATAYRTENRNIAIETSTSIDAASISDDSERGESQRAFDRPRSALAPQREHRRLARETVAREADE